MTVPIICFYLAFAGISLGAQPGAPSPPPAQLRDLPWGQLNILHSTDTHGWHGGHIQEPSYSADWGDYISFAHHLRKRADAEGVDLLVVDTGDRIEGNGLYDASDPKGKYTFDIFKHQDIDVICSGNHELYKANSSNNEFEITIPNFKGNYLSSNIDIRKNGSDEYEPLAPRYKTFTTKNLGLRIAAFGFLYNFDGSDLNTKVIPVEDAIMTDWFQKAIREDVDIFLVTGHVDIRTAEIDLIYAAIRSLREDIPILFLGGHLHIRDYRIFDSKAHALESGRYMETIGFASVSGFGKEDSADRIPRRSFKFGRRYIDNNLYSYFHHTRLNESTFPTELGINATRQITAARSALKLDEVFGCAPRNLWVSRAPVDSKDSIFPWLRERVLPDQFAQGSGNSRPKFVITNTGALRFDIFKGPFTRDSMYLVSPFTSPFRAIQNVDNAVASKLLKVLNENAPVLQELDPKLEIHRLRPPEPQRIFPRNLDAGYLNEISQMPLAPKPRTPGYTTEDDAGSDGDDTIHSPIEYFSVPNCIQAKVDFPSNEQTVEKVDIVFNEFLEPYVILALYFLGHNVREGDVTDVLGGLPFTDIIASWVQDHWPCDNRSEL